MKKQYTSMSDFDMNELINNGIRITLTDGDTKNTFSNITEAVKYLSNHINQDEEICDEFGYGTNYDEDFDDLFDTNECTPDSSLYTDNEGLVMSIETQHSFLELYKKTGKISNPRSLQTDICHLTIFHDYFDISDIEIPNVSNIDEYEEIIRSKFDIDTILPIYLNHTMDGFTLENSIYKLTKIGFIFLTKTRADVSSLNSTKDIIEYMDDVINELNKLMKSDVYELYARPKFNMDKLTLLKTYIGTDIVNNAILKFINNEDNKVIPVNKYRTLIDSHTSIEDIHTNPESDKIVFIEY